MTEARNSLLSKWIVKFRDKIILICIPYIKYDPTGMLRGKQPRTRVNKVPKLLLSESKGVFTPNGQVIGLEAAIY